MTSFIATGPNYSATIPAALGLSDARQIACADSGLMPWQITVERRNNLQPRIIEYGCVAETAPRVAAAKPDTSRRAA